jgi:hypothetical protein
LAGLLAAVYEARRRTFPSGAGKLDAVRHRDVFRRQRGPARVPRHRQAGRDRQGAGGAAFRCCARREKMLSTSTSVEKAIAA